MSIIFRKRLDSDRNIDASLYFGNIDPQVTELLMYELFIQFGPVKSINMPKDRILKTHQGMDLSNLKLSRCQTYYGNTTRNKTLWKSIEIETN